MAGAARGGDPRKCPVHRTRPARRAGGRDVRTACGLHARRPHACTRASEANSRSGAGFHVHVAEDVCDRGAVRRLCELRHARRAGLAAHCVHIDRSRSKGARRADESMWSTIRSRTAITQSARWTCRRTCAPACWSGSVPMATRRDCGMSSRPPARPETARPRSPRRRYAAAFLNNRAIVKDALGDGNRPHRNRRQSRSPAAGLLSADADRQRQPVRPPSVRHRQRPGRFADGKRPLGACATGRCVNVDERDIAERPPACAKALWDRF